MFEKTWNAVADGEGVALITAVVLGGLLLSLVLRATVAGDARSRLNAPALLLMAAAGVWLLMEVWSPTAASRRSLRALPMLLVLLAFGRLTTVALFDWALSRRLRRDAPRIVRDIAEGVILIVVLLIAANAAGVEAVPLVTTSAMITAILGLSLQDTLGNLFAGLALQAQQPFELGEWIQLDLQGTLVGRVVEMNWRATKLLNVDNQELNVPNGQLARTQILNLSRSGGSYRRVIDVILPYEFPPRRCCEVIERALFGISELLPAPAPSVVTQAYLDQGIRYRVFAYVGQFAQREAVDALIRERLWYALRRARIPIARGAGVPFGAPEAETKRDFATRIKAIRQLDFLRDLPDSAIETFAADAHTEAFASGEVVVRQGEGGEELFLCLSGELAVLLRVEGGEQREIARIRPGGLFGEFAHVSGDARAATVQALQVCELAVIGPSAFSSVLGENPEFAESISQRLAERRAQLDAAGQAVTPSTRPSVDEQRGKFLRRLRRFLAL